MPIRREDGFYVNYDLALDGMSVGIETDRLSECIDRIKRDRIKGVFGHASFGFRGDDLDFLEQMPWVESVWFSDVKLRNIEGLYSLQGLRKFGISPTRPGIDFSRFSALSTAVVHPKARDRGLDTCSGLKQIHVWRHPPRGKLFSLALPDSLQELGLFWSSLSNLDSLPSLRRLRKLEIARCRNLESLGELGSKFPRLEQLIVTACGKVRNGEGERVASELPHLSHAWVRDTKVV